MEITKDTICPDCQVNKLQGKDYEEGICYWCHCRKLASKSKNEEYVPVVDMPTTARRIVVANFKSGRLTSDTYTREVEDFVLSTNHDILTIKEIMALCIQEFPEKEFNYNGVRTFLAKRCISYKLDNASKGKRNNSDLPDVREIMKNIKAQEENEKQVEIQKSFSCAKRDVEEILNNKFKQVKCSTPIDLETDDYIHLLQDLQYLCLNYENIISHRNDQKDICNGYQDDIVHAIEIESNDIAKLSEKLHILRNKRRYYEFDRIDVNALRPLLESIDTNLLTKSLNKLISLKDARNKLTYIPKVDTTMLNKYDWAIEGELIGKRANTNLLVTNNKYGNAPLRNYEGKTLYKFRVSAKLSGGGNGAFKNWYRDYTAKTEDIALNFGKTELERYCIEHKGTIYTELSVHQINI